MFLCTRSSTDATKKSNLIDREIKGDKKKVGDTIKLLLLGPGDAGKSTFLKQLNLLHTEGNEISNRNNYIRILQDNCFHSMRLLLQCSHPDFKIPPELENDANKILNANDLNSVVSSIEVLAKSEFITNIFSSRGYYKLQIPCVSEYYWSNASRFAQHDFIPTTEDIMRSRVKTSGIQTVDFLVERLKFTIIDVGGQRSERRKWLHCFDNVTAIIFLTALDEYDMVLEEDDEISRLSESLSLWSEVTASHYFQPLVWILFLNKSDSLKKKIEQNSLHKYFDDISEEDGKNQDKCVEYFHKQYTEKYNGVNPFYTYTTCALDTKNCRKVFDAIYRSILAEALQNVSLT